MLSDFTFVPKQVIDLEKYPLDELDHEAGQHFLSECRSAYEDNGLCYLPDFIRPHALEKMVGEAIQSIGDAYFCNSHHNVYLTDNSPGPPEDDHDCHQFRRERTVVGSIPYDRIQNSFLQQLYLWDPLKDFVANVLGKPELHRLADPLGACSINVFVDGGCHGWHFDESEFSITLMLQAPDQGGDFEYAPMLRGQPEEAQRIKAILNGNRSEVHVLPFRPGTLLIFGGRQTLHRVTPVSGASARLVPVLCYSQTPNLMNSPTVQTLFWGRTADESRP